MDPLPIAGLLDRDVSKVMAILSKPAVCETEPPNLLERTLFWRYFHRYGWMLEKRREAGRVYEEAVSQLEYLAARNRPVP